VPAIECQFKDCVVNATRRILYENPCVRLHASLCTAHADYFKNKAANVPPCVAARFEVLQVFDAEAGPADAP
jgi:hypothetical protein